MNADRLREAARVLRERAADTTASPWGFAGVQDQGFAVHRGAHDTVALYASRPDAAYIAAVHPEVGKALADWLDDEAFMVAGAGRITSSAAVDVADAILGGES